MARTLATAAHEAAHAVVGCYLGLRCQGVKILEKKSEYAGWAAFNAPATKRLAFGCMLAAGPSGDELRCHQDKYGWSGDLSMLRDHGFLPAEIRMLRDLAAHYLAGPLSAKWERVTEVLLHRDVSGKEVRAFVLHDENLED